MAYWFFYFDIIISAYTLFQTIFPLRLIVSNNHSFNIYTSLVLAHCVLYPQLSSMTRNITGTPYLALYLTAQCLTDLAGGMETSPQSHITDLVLFLSLPLLFSLSLAFHSAQRGTGGWKAERRHLRDNETAKAHLQPAPAYIHSCLILSPTLWSHRGGDSRLESCGLFFCRSSFWRRGEFASIIVNVDA